MSAVPGMTPPLLSVRDLVTEVATARGPMRAVDQVSFDLADGEILGLVGESGSGKTVTLRSILRLVAPPARVAGTILWRGRNLVALPERELRAIRGREIAAVFQEPMTALNPVLTIGLQIEENLQAHTMLTARERRRRAIELLDIVGIPAAASRLDGYPHQFSGGMRQRAMIAIAIASNPRLLLADEPTTALDVTIQDQILKLILTLRQQLGMSVIFVTHDLGVVAETCDRVAVMYAGRIIETGSVATVFAGPRHPYTAGLLASVPRTGGERRPLQSIPGTPPPLSQRSGDCAFAPRCAFATDHCRQRQPTLSAVAPDHAAACWHPEALTTAPPRTAAIAPPPRAPSRPTATTPLFEVAGLVKGFPVRRSALARLLGKPQRVVHALNGPHFVLGRGETLGIVGESGCGKSTLAQCLVRLIEADAGTIRYDGIDIRTLRGAARRGFNRRVQMIFQDPYGSLNPRMTVRQILGEALHVHHMRPAAAIPDRITALLDLVRLPADAADRYPHAFSGGQRQRIGIARALAVEPECLIADELVSALDVSVQAQVVNLLLDLQNQLGLSVLFVAHDLRLVRHISHRVAVMYLGEIVEIAPTEALFAAPRHPYTQALLSAVPDIDHSRRTLRIAVRGELPSPLAPPPGCPFHPRCAQAIDRCRRERPALTARGGDRLFACHLAPPQDGAAAAPRP
ncbi:MAG: ABC transporter ATP-binding protein [Azospirillaceae bacterium]|nr:ABC transporter ATP-binding protein [Azospirillaceae bacterium]